MRYKMVVEEEPNSVCVCVCEREREREEKYTKKNGMDM
jgi:hypothetical protein